MGFFNFSSSVEFKQVVKSPQPFQGALLSVKSIHFPLVEGFSLFSGNNWHEETNELKEITKIKEITMKDSEVDTNTVSIWSLGD